MKLNEAKMGGVQRDPFMTDGNYLVELEDFGMRESEDPAKLGAPFFKASFKIHESDNPKHPVGSKGVWILSGPALGYGAGDILNALGAALGINPTEATEEDSKLVTLIFRYLEGAAGAEKEIAPHLALLSEIVGKQFTRDFYKGRFVRLTCRPNKKNSFTFYNWAPTEQPKVAA